MLTADATVPVAVPVDDTGLIVLFIAPVPSVTIEVLLVEIPCETSPDDTVLVSDTEFIVLVVMPVPSVTTEVLAVIPCETSLDGIVSVEVAVEVVTTGLFLLGGTRVFDVGAVIVDLKLVSVVFDEIVLEALPEGSRSMATPVRDTIGGAVLPSCIVLPVEVMRLDTGDLIPVVLQPAVVIIAVVLVDIKAVVARLMSHEEQMLGSECR